MRSPHTAMKSSPRWPQLEKAHAQRQRPNAAKKKKKSVILYQLFKKNHHNNNNKKENTQDSYMFMYLWLPRETRTIWRNSLNLGINSGLTRGKVTTILQSPLLQEPGNRITVKKSKH